MKKIIAIVVCLLGSQSVFANNLHEEDLIMRGERIQTGPAESGLRYDGGMTSVPWWTYSNQPIASESPREVEVVETEKEWRPTAEAQRSGRLGTMHRRNPALAR